MTLTLPLTSQESYARTLQLGDALIRARISAMELAAKRDSGALPALTPRAQRVRQQLVRLYCAASNLRANAAVDGGAL